MKRLTSTRLSLSLSFFVAIFAGTPIRAQSLGAELPVPGNYESETLTRGPLHEAFAEQVNYDAQPGITVRKPPPEPIEEIPPDVQPEGNNIQWIPGYWAWDDERDDFLWVSGVWRDVPPDREWAPGYWAEADAGYQWIAGFWNLNSANQVEYLPYPPESLERGPTSPLPSVNHFWVSGCWQYQAQRYLWQPGFWSSYREDWVWTPAHYVWTPRGVIYIRGYWDYPLARRGVLFAPVYFPHFANYQPRYQYSPSVVIDLNLVLVNLFVQPSHHHYYWGDYYGDRYRRSGYQANYAFHGHRGYDPLFNYYNTQQRRQGIDYTSRLRNLHSSHELHQDQRPPRTWNQQQALTSHAGNHSPSSRQFLAQPLRDAIKDSHSGVKYRQVDNDQRQAFSRRSNELRELSQHRHSDEATSRVTAARRSGDLARQLNVGRASTKPALSQSTGRDSGFGGRVNFGRPESRQIGSSASRATPSIERATPDRAASSGQDARAPQFGRSGVQNRSLAPFDSGRSPPASPPGFSRPEPAPKQAIAQPNRTPMNRTQRTPERSAVVPSAQPTPRLALPQAANQQRYPRPTTTPSPQPSFSSRRPFDNSARTRSVPRLQPKPEITRQFSDRQRQTSASTPQSTPRAMHAQPAPQARPSFRPPQHHARPAATSAGRSNAPSARSSSHSQRPSPAPRREDHNGRSRR